VSKEAGRPEKNLLGEIKWPGPSKTSKGIKGMAEEGGESLTALDNKGGSSSERSGVGRGQLWAILRDGRPRIGLKTSVEEGEKK